AKSSAKYGPRSPGKPESHNGNTFSTESAASLTRLIRPDRGHLAPSISSKDDNNRQRKPNLRSCCWISLDKQQSFFDHVLQDHASLCATAKPTLLFTSARKLCTAS